MDAETINNLTTAGAAMGGALVGGGATVWATTIQQRHERRSELEREARAEERRRREATEARAQLAAERCDTLVTQLADMLSHDNNGEPGGTEAHTSASPLLQELSFEAVFLPKELQQRLDEAALVLQRASDLYREHYYGQVSWAAHTVQRDIHNAIAAWLRGDQLPSRSPNMADFILASERVNDFYEELYNEHEGHDIDERQEEWREENVEELVEIMKRGPAT